MTWLIDYAKRGDEIITVYTTKTNADGSTFTISAAPDAETTMAEMVQACNAHAELVTALTAIVARINGEWDNPALVGFGPLDVNSDNDILAIANAALAKAGTT
jgi:hypothetical protein